MGEDDMRRKRIAPVHFTSSDTAIMTWTLGVLAIARGLDYSSGSDTISAANSLLESIVDLRAWGAAALLGGSLVLSGMACRWHRVVWAGHALLSMLYTLVGVSVLISAFHSPWWNGARGAGPILAVGAIHYLLAVRRGPTPEPEEVP